MELTEGLNRRKGVHADLLTMYSENFEGHEETKEELKKKGVSSIRGLGLKPGQIHKEMIRGIWDLRTIIRGGSYDVVETSQIGPTILTCWANLGLSVQHVGSVRQTFERTPIEGFRDWFFRTSVRVSRRSRYYAISQNTARHWEKYMGFPLGSTRVIYNSIPDEFFGPCSNSSDLRNELDIPGEGHIVLLVGRLVRMKGIDTAIDALGPILDKENLYLLYVGDSTPPDFDFEGDRDLLNRLKDRVSREGWSKRVRFLGRRYDVSKLMASSAMLIHPSRREAFGRTLAEGLAAGIPIVASNVGGIPEVLNGTDSIMVDPDDWMGLREGVLKILRRSPLETERAAAKGRQRAEEFRVEKRVDNMISLFEEVLEGVIRAEVP
jgi:glycosyltransferase involved in cell wall biosynthesis